MKKYIISTFLIAFISLVNIKISYAEDNTPLMIIRFSQDFVNYERSLEKVVNSALDAKPSTFFDIVSVVPETANTKQNKLLYKDANFLTNQVAENIQLSGVSKNNIRITYQNSKIAKNSEVHIFVR